MLAAACRSTKERNLFIIALIFSSLVWVALVVSLVGLLYAPFVAVGVALGHAFLLARITGNAVRVGTRQLPDLYKRIEAACQKLGLERIPEVYVTSGGGVLNAFATKLFSRKFVILNAEILDACETLDEGKAPGDASAVDFIIGHELGHLALGHLSWSWLLWPAKLVPLLGPAYSRACEYSSDACGLAAAGDVETSARALAVLAAGGRQARKVSVDALLEQRHETGSLIMALVELSSTHPYLSKRAAALHRARDAGMAPDVGRNPMSYVLAPFFGFAAGGVTGLATVYLYVCVVGILAAVAIPNFMKFQQRAKAAAAQHQLDDNAAQAGLLAPNGDAQPQDLNALLAQIQAQQAGGSAGGLAGDADGAGNDAANTLGTGGLGVAGTAAAPPPPARHEARAWLREQRKAKNHDAIANLSTNKALALVDRLYKDGAPRVWVSDLGVDDKGAFANDIIADMPAKVSSRKKLVAVCTVEFKKQGYDEPCVDSGPLDTTQLIFNFVR